TVSVGNARRYRNNEPRWLDWGGSFLRREWISHYNNSPSLTRLGRLFMGVLGETGDTDSSARHGISHGPICPYKARRSIEDIASLGGVGVVSHLSGEYPHYIIWMATVGRYDPVELGD